MISPRSPFSIQSTPLNSFNLTHPSVIIFMYADGKSTSNCVATSEISTKIAHLQATVDFVSQ